MNNLIYRAGAQPHVDTIIEFLGHLPGSDFRALFQEFEERPDACFRDELLVALSWARRGD